MNEDISRHPLNAPGRYYVDCNTCLDHQCCVDAAPNNFKMDETYTAYVFKQPDTEEEEGQCRQALEECPMEAIHDDGNTNLTFAHRSLNFFSNQHSVAEHYADSRRS